MNYHDFPILSKQDKLVYLDNACVTLVPQVVIDAVNDYYTSYPSCGGRSSHRLANIVTSKVQATRELVAKFINAETANEIIFTKNTTESLNLVAHSLNLQAGDVVLTTDKEHNSNLIVWQLLAKEKGIVHKVVASNSDNSFDLEGYKKIVSETKNLKLVSMVWVSNLDGVSIPAKEVIAIAHSVGALVMLDGAQAVPHKKTDVYDLDVDFLAFSGHKMLGPSATGVLYGKASELAKLQPFIVGGSTVANSTYSAHEFLPVPERFEAGLQNYAGIIGLGEAVKYLENIGFDYIAERELKMNSYITAELANLPKLKLIGPKDASARAGIFDFYIDGLATHQIAVMLDEMAGILVRSGRHCVHSWFEEKKILNSVRASFYFYNTDEEAEKFVNTIKKIIKLV